MSPAAVGADLPRRDAEDKLRGRTRYAVDSSRAGMLHAALRRADVAAGRILRVDTTAAREMPGVRAIVGADDAPGRYGVGIADHPLFATGEIRYHGEPIVAVAAETLEQARAAAAAVVVEVEPYDAHLTMAEALTPGARDVHPGWRDYEVMHEGGQREGNIAWESSVVRGDTDAAFARDDVVIVTSEFTAGRQNQAALEPRVCVASYEDGRFVLETSTQVPWSVRNNTATLLGISPSSVRVVVPAVGGGFGGKFEVSCEPFAALLARASGRPVRVVYSREEEMLTSVARENAEIRIRSAVTRDGEILAREAVVLMDCGAYGGEQPFLTTMTAHTLGGNYRLGAVRLVSRAVYTNTAPTGAFRACNGTYNTFALERHTDEICAAIGMDRFVFRRRNVLGDGDLGSTGQVFQGDVLGPMLDRMVTLREAAPELPADDGRLRGTSTVVGMWAVGVGPSAATVNVNADGSVTLITSGVEIGSGSTIQAIPQIVADTLGVRAEDVVVLAADTDAAGYDVGVGGGRTTVSLGAAGTAAGLDARRKLLDVAADMLEAAPEDLLLADGHVSVVGDPDQRLTIAAVAAHAQDMVGPISGSGSFASRREATAIPGCAAGHMVDALDIPIFAVHECDVAVHPETGHVEVLAYRVVQDVGIAINPRAIAGQIQGGVVQGLGYALHEEITIGEDGQIRQRGFESYRPPLVKDVVTVQADLYEGAPSYGPLGAKGTGEIPILPVPAAIACAVADAIGQPVQRIPLTPPRVLGLLLDDVEGPVDLTHLSPDWRGNVLGDVEARLAAAASY
jgi:CO/xanthine dehydrogenase Mo-binding subunit